MAWDSCPGGSLQCDRTKFHFSSIASNDKTSTRLSRGHGFHFAGEVNETSRCGFVHVGIHTASATFSSISLDVVLSAIFDVHLVFDELVASEYHAWLHLPHKEAVVGGIDISGYELLHGEVET